MYRLKEHKEVIRRGDIFYADLSPVIGSEQGGVRPVLILQNNIGNCYSPTVIAAPITTRMIKASIPTHVSIGKQGRQGKESIVLLEQIRTLDKARLQEKAGHLTDGRLRLVDMALMISVGLVPAYL